MDLNLRFREIDEHGDRIEMSGSYKLAETLLEALTPKVKAILKKFKKDHPADSSEMANVNITNRIIEQGSEKDAHMLMIYSELIDVFELPDTALANEGY